MPDRFAKGCANRTGLAPGQSSDRAKRGELGLAGEDCPVEVEFGSEEGRPILRSTWGMSLVLKEPHDRRCTSRAQRLNKALNGSYWYNRVIEAMGQEYGAVDPGHEIGRRAGLVARKTCWERPDEAV